MDGRFLAYDGHTRFHIRLADIDGHAACESSCEPIRDISNRSRRPVGRKDNLLIRVVKRIKQMKKFLLSLLLLREKLYIVHDKEVVLAIFILEPIRTSRL